MKIRRIAFGLLVFSIISCNYVSQLIVPPTVTPLPTFSPTATATLTPTPTATPLVLAFIPPECSSQPIATLSPGLSLQLTPEFSSEDISQQSQLEILEEIVGIVKEVYVYTDYNGRDWSEIATRYRAMVEAGLTTDVFYVQMKNMIRELGDEHSEFISPIDIQKLEKELRGEIEYVGVGIYSDVDYERERLVVISTYPGSPAELSGIQAHDSILFVDGLPITQESEIRTYGPICSAVVVTVQSPGESPRDVMLIRSSTGGSIPIDARKVPTTDGSNVGYIYIPSFFDETLPPQIENALEEFGHLDGLILDLRTNGGGINTVVYPILSLFTKGKLGEFVSRTASRGLTIEANPIYNSQTVPLVIMVGEGTVSFGEIFAGILRDARDAKIVGETSLGNVEVLHEYDFEDGSVIWIASETFDSEFSDDDWEETGIVPDVQAPAEWDTFYFETDPAIPAALELLGHH